MWVKQTAKRQLIATQNAQQLTILIQKFKTFYEVRRSPGKGYSTLADPIPSGEGTPPNTTSPLGAFGVAIFAPSALDLWPPN